MATVKLVELNAQWVTAESFQPYGQVIYARIDGKPYDAQDEAQLVLQNGIPRFYIMRLQNKGHKFHTITRHVKCTQCLGSLGGKDWLIAVAPAEATQPRVEAIAAFRIPGDCFIKLNQGTWHAGPYFNDEFVDFYNLEFSDTNIDDHDTYDFRENGLELEILALLD